MFTKEPAIRSILTYVSHSVERDAMSAARAFLCVDSAISTRWDSARFSRMASNWVGMVFLCAVILCIEIAGCPMRRMSVVVRRF